MTITLSVLVFQWLRFYVGSTTETNFECPEDTSLIITDASCTGNSLSIQLKNKGRHTIDGFTVRANDRQDAEQGFNAFPENTTSVLPGNIIFIDYQLSSASPPLSSLTLIEVQPFKNFDGKNIYCGFVDSIKITCTP